VVQDKSPRRSLVPHTQFSFMFFDLNVTWSSRWSQAIVDIALRLGYAGVAFNETVRDKQVLELKRHQSTILPCRLPLPSQACGPLRGNMAAALGVDDGDGVFLQLRRLTVVIANEAQLNAANQAIATLKPHYHLIAMRPITEEAFQLVCQCGQADILSLPLGEKRSFPWKQASLKEYLNRGGFFEIEFAPALRDGGKRRVLIENVGAVLLATHGRNVFVSSSAADPMEMRSPHDLANFAAVLGLRGQQARQSLAGVPYRVLQHGMLRQGFAQVVATPAQGPALEKAFAGRDVAMEDAT